MIEHEGGFPERKVELTWNQLVPSLLSLALTAGIVVLYIMDRWFSDAQMSVILGLPFLFAMAAILVCFLANIVLFIGKVPDRNYVLAFGITAFLLAVGLISYLVIH